MLSCGRRWCLRSPHLSTTLQSVRTIRVRALTRVLDKTSGGSSKPISDAACRRRRDVRSRTNPLSAEAARSRIKLSYLWAANKAKQIGQYRPRRRLKHKPRLRSTPLQHEPEVEREPKGPRPSPSRYLVKALEIQGLGHLVTTGPAWKVDLSHVNPTHHDHPQWKSELRRKAEVRIDLQDLQHAPVSLTTIVASNVLAQGTDSKRWQVFGPKITGKENRYLADRGYSPESVVTWVHVLTDEDDEVAARRLRWETKSGTGKNAFLDLPLPAFLPLALLRRPDLSPTALEDIIYRIWAEVLRRERLPHARLTIMSEQMFMIIVRLLRRVRKSWPAAMVSVTRMFLRYFKVPSTTKLPSDPRHVKSLQRRTLLYNKVLSLLALAPRSGSFRLLPYVQRAQFDVVGAMASHTPPLHISRDGFRAIIAVQAAHRKTAQEQDWSSLKVKSWPPWKEDKTGLDAEKDQEYGASRAMQAINSTVEAGYALGNWEKVAKILSGWDIDNSPTIQTRARLHTGSVRTDRSLRSKNIINELSGYSHHPENSRIWAARVQATRTLREAWACFLSYQDVLLLRSPRSLSEIVYDAMLRKLLSQTQNVDKDTSDEDRGDDRRPLEPGDARELLPEPVSPRETTWTRTGVPSAEELAQTMIDNNIQFRDDNFALLISTAANISTGIKYVHWYSLSSSNVAKSLLYSDQNAILQQVSYKIYLAYIRLLCRFPSSSRKQIVEGLDTAWHVPRTPFFRAIRLSIARTDLPELKDQTLPIILKALEAQTSFILETDVPGSSRQHVAPASFIKRLFFLETHAQKLDARPVPQSSTVSIHRTYLVLRERAILAALDLKHQQEHNPRAMFSAGLTLFQIDHLLASTSATVQDVFYAAVGGVGDDDQHNPARREEHDLHVPPLMHVPSPHILHGMVRLMGFLRDFEGILRLLGWIARHEATLTPAIEEPRNGKVLLRRAVVAARVCFERSWTRRGMLLLSELAATEEELARLREVIDGADLLGAWPTEKEVDKYVWTGKEGFPVGDE